MPIIGKIDKFISDYCKERKDGSIMMNNRYLTYRISKNKTASDGLIKFFIEHGITKVEGYKDFCKNEKSIVACIGFSEKEQKWYGWSHRAIYGFGVGYIAKKGDCVTTSGWTDDYLAKHPEADLSVKVGFRVKNMEDAKKCAIAFAESVS